MKTYHFICKVEDSINDHDVVAEVYCDESTPKKAEAFFRKNKNIKRYIGNKRYKIYFRQNSILIQDNYEWLQKWKKQR